MDELQEFLDGFTESLQSNWPSGEVQAIIAARIAGKTEQEIRELVVYLHAKRQSYRLPVLQAEQVTP